MSKELYKEYVSDWVNADSWDKREKINDLYLIDFRTLSYELECRGNDRCDMYSIASLNCAGFTRVPKKHNINGHEVIAPRFDMPKSGRQCYWVDFMIPRTFQTCAASSLTNNERIILVNNGWFDNKKDIVAYTKALLGSK